MIVNAWKTITIVMSALLIIMLVQPMITGLASLTPVSNKPIVELFVMSHCPYGTQAEKGIIPAIEALGDNVDFKLRFVYYAMHGETEINEQIKQHCIQENEPNKLIDYLTCFLDEGNSESCLTQAGINTQSLDSCIDTTDTQYNITNLYNDQSSWLSGRFPLFTIDYQLNQQYEVKGSPTLIINGERAQPSDRSPQAYLNTICDYYNVKPNACNTQLSNTAYNPGFGYLAGSSTTASCG